MLGGGEFVEGVLEEAEERENERLRLSARRMPLVELEAKVIQRVGLAEGEIRTAARRRVVVLARRAFSQLAVRRLGYTGAEVARFLGVTTSCVNRAAGSIEMDALATEVVNFGLS